MERLVEVAEAGVMTINTSRRRTSKHGQILRAGNQIWHRRCMTRSTGVVMNVYNHIGVCMTACCTISVNGDRGVTQAAAVRCMVIVTVHCTGLVRMTVGTGDCGTGCYHAGYCAGRRIVMLTVTTVIRMTRITVAGLVAMQRDNLAPGADRCMTVTAAAAAGCLVRSSIISYIMTTVRTRMDRMTVKVSGMTR